jgi:hypothetical protein
MFLAVEQSSNIDYTYFTHLTFKYILAYFDFNCLLLVASSERPSFGNASGTIRLKLEDT